MHVTLIFLKAWNVTECQKQLLLEDEFVLTKALSRLKLVLEIFWKESRLILLFSVDESSASTDGINFTTVYHLYFASEI